MAATPWPPLRNVTQAYIFLYNAHNIHQYRGTQAAEAPPPSPRNRSICIHTFTNKRYDIHEYNGTQTAGTPRPPPRSTACYLARPVHPTAISPSPSTPPLSPSTPPQFRSPRPPHRDFALPVYPTALPIHRKAAEHRRRPDLPVHPPAVSTPRAEPPPGRGNTGATTLFPHREE